MSEEEMKKLGTQVMGKPASPSISVHPYNHKATQDLSASTQQYYFTDHPYIVLSPVNRTPENKPLEYVVNSFNTWSRRSEQTAHNIWNNLKTGPSVCGAAWGKMNLAAKALTEGGFESLFKQMFPVDPREHLKKTFACYFSTTTGPVAGTLYLSTARLAFCSDRPLSFPAPSGQQILTYYKVSIPLGSIQSVNPVTMSKNTVERYIHIVTVDQHEFWLMGFVNFEKASHHLLDTLHAFKAAASPSLIFVK